MHWARGSHTPSCGPPVVLLPHVPDGKIRVAQHQNGDAAAAAAAGVQCYGAGFSWWSWWGVVAVVVVVGRGLGWVRVGGRGSMTGGPQEEGGVPVPGPPPPQTKVIIVGNNEVYHWENLVGPFLVHQNFGSQTPPPSSNTEGGRGVN